MGVGTEGSFCLCSNNESSFKYFKQSKGARAMVFMIHDA